MGTSFGCSLIIFLYLLDNEYTSRIVLFSVGGGMFVEAWKIFRIGRGQLHWAYALPWATWGGGGVLVRREDQVQVT